MSPAFRAMTPHGCGLPARAADVLEEAGFSVAGVIGAREYDALVPEPWRSSAWMPGARSALVLGTGGGGFEAGWRAFRANEAVVAPDPIDRFTREVMARFVRVLGDAVGEPAAGLAATHLYCDRREAQDGRSVFADFVALARACGLGAPSRLGLLIHPEYGPWWSVRVVALLRLDLAATANRGGAEGFDPCSDCAAPCERACPAAAVAAGGLDAGRCAAHRRGAVTCASRCDARRACPVGRSHALGPDEEAMYAAASMEWIRSGIIAGRDPRP